MLRPPFSPFPELSNERVRLCEVQAEHVAALQEITYYDSRPAASHDEAQAMTARIDGDYRTGQTVHWAILDAATQEPVGTIGYYRGFLNETGEIGFVLRERFRRRGLMSAALHLAVAFGNDVLQLQRIIAITQANNVAAMGLLRRCGFSMSGRCNSDKVEMAFSG